MALSPNHPFIFSATLMLLSIFASFKFTGAQIGVSYGFSQAEAGLLPPPPQVVALFQNNNIRRMRIYEPRSDVLEALRGSGIELTVGIPNDKLQDLANNEASAAAWISDNILNYPNVLFKHIITGNEVTDTEYAPFLLPAMKNVFAALDAAGRRDIMVTTAISMADLSPSEYPRQGEFRPEVKEYMGQIVGFLVENGAPIFANIYPYFAYRDNRDKIPYNYAFLEPDSGITTPDGVYYDNLYYAMVDTLNAALEKITPQVSLAQNGFPRPPPKVYGGETGVPTEGETRLTAEGGEISSIENARRYNNNLVRVVKTGTPMRPGSPIETYIFEMFDENMKQGEAIERHFGLFLPNGEPKYVVDFS